MKVVKMLIFSIILTGLITLISQADPSLDELDQQKKEIENRIELSKAEIVNKKQEIKRNEIKLKDLKGQLFLTVDNIKSFQQQIIDLEADITIKESEINAILLEIQTIEANQLKYTDYLAQRIDMMYELGDPTFTEVILGSKSLEDMMTRMVYIDEIIAYDQLVFEKMKVNHELTVIAKEALDLEKSNLDHLVAETTLKKEELQAVAEDTTQKVESTESSIAYIAKSAEELQKEVEEEIADLKEIEALIEYVKFLNSRKLAGGAFLWPVDGYTYISSPFGTRADPITGQMATHYGIDIPAPTGTPILATMSGEVVEAKYSNSYGNKIVLYHGVDENDRAVSSLYAHNSELLVSTGQVVKKGDVIAYAGSTGRSTGAHLHFAILVEGVWVDPMTYKPSE